MGVHAGPYLLHLMERKLVKNGKGHLTGYLPNYVSFRMALGMVNRCGLMTFGTRTPLRTTRG